MKICVLNLGLANSASVHCVLVDVVEFVSGFHFIIVTYSAALWVFSIMFPVSFLFLCGNIPHTITSGHQCGDCRCLK